MMAPSHAMSGALAGLGTAAAATVLGSSVPPLAAAVMAGVGAGAALLPDWDHPRATVSRAFGPLSVWIAQGVRLLSLGVYKLTRSSSDSRGRGTHRTLTHTLVAALAVGAGVWALVERWGVIPMLITLYLMLGLALRGLFGDWAKKNGWITVNLLTLALTGGSHFLFSTAEYGAEAAVWIGASIASGMLAHSLGDMITHHGVPLLWPLPIGGRRWYKLRLPRGIRLTTGSWVERWVIWPLLTVGTLSTGYAIVML